MSPLQTPSHRCSHCAREFVRAEHLVRHERIQDTKEKPFSCKLCEKSFSRTDLLRRHEKKSHPSRLTARITRPGVASPQHREIRIPESPTATFNMEGVDLPNTWPFDGGSTDWPPPSQTGLALSLSESLLPDDLFWLHQLQSLDRTVQLPPSSDEVGPQTTGDTTMLSRPGSPLLEILRTEPAQQLETADATIPGISQARWTAMQEELESCGHGNGLPSQFCVSKYARRYFESFHRHQPFLHAATWSFETARTALILAISASGALYSLEGEAADNLYQAAVACFRYEEPGLWTLQTLMVLTAYKAWSGKSDDLQTALGFFGEITLLVRREWARMNSGSEPVTWELWCEQESLRRVTYCVFTLTTLINVAYDITAPINLEDRFGMPSHESQWAAKSEDEWNRSSQRHASAAPYCSAAAVADDIMSDEAQNIPSRIPAFGCHIIVSCLVQRIILFRKASPKDDAASAAMYHRFLRALRRWQRVWEREPSASLSPSSPHGPMLFNSTALLRLAYMRLVTDYSPVRQHLSWCDSIDVIEASIREVSQLTRGPDATRAALHACLALRVPVQLGFNVVARTSFWGWSVQHPVCYFECALVLSAWLLCLSDDGVAQVTPEEWKVIDLIQQALAISHTDALSTSVLTHMASAVLQQWSQLFDTRETTVWGLIPKLSRVLRTHSELINQI